MPSSESSSRRAHSSIEIFVGVGITVIGNVKRQVIVLVIFRLVALLRPSSALLAHPGHPGHPRPRGLRGGNLQIISAEIAC
jgi:hypothetical protein